MCTTTSGSWLAFHSSLLLFVCISSFLIQMSQSRHVWHFIVLHKEPRVSLFLFPVAALFTSPDELSFLPSRVADAAGCYWLPSCHGVGDRKLWSKGWACFSLPSTVLSLLSSVLPTVAPDGDLGLAQPGRLSLESLESGTWDKLEVTHPRDRSVGVEGRSPCPV